MKKRIQEKSSRTAELTCLSRALSFYDKRTDYKSGDYLANIFFSSIENFIMKHRLFTGLLNKLFYPKGMYEYVISRTKYIDDFFNNNLDNIEQVLIFGAGFDTRSIRFSHKLENKKCFELDSYFTQQLKINKFQKSNVNAPDNVVFIPIDFQTESIIDKLNEAAFRKNKKSLFILEGLTMYLDEKSINDTFNIIKNYSGNDSIIIFDYIYKSVLRKENIYYGEKDGYNTVLNADEQWTYGIEKGQIENFISNYGFELIDESDSNKLEMEYFNKENKPIINGTHCIVTTKKK